MGVSCVIPAYKEGKRILKVLRAVRNHNLVDEIIVVADDKATAKIAQDKDIIVISNRQRCGKAMAMKQGVERAKNEMILFLDADLKGLTKKDVSKLILPVLRNETDMTMSLRKNLKIWRYLGVDIVTGERCLCKSIFNQLDIDEDTGYLVEMMLNDLVIKNNLRTRIIDLKNVENTLKSYKMNFFEGLVMDISIILHVIHKMTLLTFFYQMHSLRPK